MGGSGLQSAGSSRLGRPTRSGRVEGGEDSRSDGGDESEGRFSGCDAGGDGYLGVGYW